MIQLPHMIPLADIDELPLGTVVSFRIVEKTIQQVSVCSDGQGKVTNHTIDYVIRDAERLPDVPPKGGDAT